MKTITNRNVLVAIFACLFFNIFCPVYSQKTHAYFLLELLNPGKKKSLSKNNLKNSGEIILKNDSIKGLVTIDGNKISIEPGQPYEKDIKTSFKITDTALRSIKLFNASSSMVLMPLPDFDNKLWRKIFDYNGLKLFDLSFSFSYAADDIDCDNLLFEYNNKYYPAVKFWTTSTKKNMIKILNNIFRLSLNPKDYKNKNELLRSILSQNDRIFKIKEPDSGS